MVDVDHLRRALAECGAVLRALIDATTWEIAPSVKEVMIIAEHKARTALNLSTQENS